MDEEKVDRSILDTLETDMTPKQVRQLREELKAHSFKFVKDVPTLDSLKGKMPYLSGKEWYQDSQGFNVIIEKVPNESRYEVSYDTFITPLVEDVLRNP